MAHQIDIREELWQACQAFETGDTERKLDKLGIAPSTYWQGPAVLGEQRVVTHRDGSYQPHPDGTPALVVPVSAAYTMDDFDPIDLVAFHPSNPYRLWHRIDIAPLLHLDAIHRAQHFGEVLGVWRSPLTWLQWEKQGTVILDWSLDLKFWLAGIGEIWLEDHQTESRFRANLKEPSFKGELFVIDAPEVAA